MATLLHEPNRALFEHLILAPVRTSHYVENVLNAGYRDIVVKQIAHRIDEDPLGPLPPQHRGDVRSLA